MNSENIKDIFKRYSISFQIENPLYYDTSSYIQQPIMFDYKSKSTNLKDFNYLLGNNICLDKNKNKFISAGSISNLDNDRNLLNLDVNSKNTIRRSHCKSLFTRDRHSDKLADLIKDFNKQIKIRNNVMKNINNIRMTVTTRKLHKDKNKIVRSLVSSSMLNLESPSKVKRSLTKKGLVYSNLDDYENYSESSNETGVIFMELINKARQMKAKEFHKTLYYTQEELQNKKLQKNYNHLIKIADDIKFNQKINDKTDNLNKLIIKSNQKQSNSKHFNTDLLSVLDFKGMSFTGFTPESPDVPLAKLIFTNKFTNEKGNFKIERRNDIQDVIDTLEKEGSIVESPLLRKYIGMNNFKLEIKIENSEDSILNMSTFNLNRDIPKEKKSNNTMNSSMITEGYL